MEYFTEQAPSYAECIAKIKMKYGDNVRLHTRRTVRIGGVLGFFAKDGVEIGGSYVPEAPRGAFDPARAARRPLDVEEEKRKILEQRGQAKAADPQVQQILAEVRGLKETLSSSLAASSRAGEEHATVAKIADLLARNDFSEGYARSILDRVKKEFSLDALDDFDAVQDRVVEWIGESVKIYKDDAFQTRPRVMVLVGPTGVGKTTTIAKLAAVYGIGGSASRPLSVRMITIDNYRIGAKAQVETYGVIMGIPVSCVETYDDLRQTIALYSQDVDLVLVDTIGKSPRDYMKLAEMKELLAACGNSADVHLALSATTKSSDMREILQQFEPFNYRSVIVTKLDETIRVGNVVSALAEKGKAVSYVTDGQRVPMDISRAATVRFLTNLEGFRIDRRRVDERFPQDPSGKIEWR